MIHHPARAEFTLGLNHPEPFTDPVTTITPTPVPSPRAFPSPTRPFPDPVSIRPVIARGMVIHARAFPPLVARLTKTARVGATEEVLQFRVQFFDVELRIINSEAGTP